MGLKWLFESPWLACVNIRGAWLFSRQTQNSTSLDLQTTRQFQNVSLTASWRVFLSWHKFPYKSLKIKETALCLVWIRITIESWQLRLEPLTSTSIFSWSRKSKFWCLLMCSTRREISLYPQCCNLHKMAIIFVKSSSLDTLILPKRLCRQYCPAWRKLIPT